VLETLSTHIDPSSIPAEFGGSLDWTYGDDSRPNLDNDTKEMLGLDEVPEGPVRWFGKEKGAELRGSGRDKKVEEAIEEKLESRRGSRMNTPQKKSSPIEGTPKSQTSTGGGGFETPNEGGSTDSSVLNTPKTNTDDDDETNTPATTTSSVDLTSEEKGAGTGFTPPPPVGFADLKLGSTKATAQSASSGSEEHDISVAARENPSAPLKDLAATLEGTTL